MAKNLLKLSDLHTDEIIAILDRAQMFCQGIDRAQKYCRSGFFSLGHLFICCRRESIFI